MHISNFGSISSESKTEVYALKWISGSVKSVKVDQIESLCQVTNYPELYTSVSTFDTYHSE